jgi:hypothetical protein
MKAYTSFAIMWALNTAFFFFCLPSTRTGIRKVIATVAVSFAASATSVITLLLGLVVSTQILGIKI